MSHETVTFKQGEIICKQGEDTSDLFFIVSGKALVFGIEGTKVTPLANIDENEFIGELAFLDNKKRSAYVMAKEDCEILKIDTHAKEHDMPEWTLRLAKAMATRLREIDDVILKKGIKRKNTISIEPLTIEEQREILERIQ